MRINRDQNSKASIPPQYHLEEDMVEEVVVQGSVHREEADITVIIRGIRTKTDRMKKRREIGNMALPMIPMINGKRLKIPKRAKKRRKRKRNQRNHTIPHQMTMNQI